MARGNQRDVAREKAAKAKKAGENKKTGNPQARKEADQAALQAKIAAKASAKEAEGTGAAATTKPAQPVKQ